MPQLRPRRRRDTDHGGSILEYAAVFALVAVLAGAVVAMAPGVGATITEGVNSLLCAAMGGEDCGDEAPAAAPETVETEEPRLGGDETDAVTSDAFFEAPEEVPIRPAYHDSGGSGGGFGPGDGVGPPMPPDEAPPASDARQPDFHDEGSGGGEFNSEPLKWYDYLPLGRANRLHDLWLYYYLVATGGDLVGMDDAADLLKHFLNASGDDYEVDVEQMLADVPSFQEQVDSDVEALARDCVAQASEAGADEPMTCQISTPWYNHAITSGEDRNWYFGLGSWFYGFTGNVTVQPPDEPGGEWTYEVETQVNVIKTYDWDPDADRLGPGGMFNQADLAELHRAGLAQDFLVHGSTGSDTYEGTTRAPYRSTPCDPPTGGEQVPC